MAEGEQVQRFASLDDDELTQLLDGKDSQNTKKVISFQRKVQNDYFHDKDGQFKSIADMDDAPVEEVVKTLRKFYGEVRQADGSLYAKKSLITLRFGLQNIFSETRKEDIVHNEHYEAANIIFMAAMVKLKKEDKGVVNHKEPISVNYILFERKSNTNTRQQIAGGIGKQVRYHFYKFRSLEPISSEDMNKLYEHDTFSLKTSESLQRNVFLEYLYYFCNSGRENIRDVLKSDYEMKTDAKGLRYVQMKMVRQIKNHSGEDLRDVDDKDGRMYEIPGN